MLTGGCFCGKVRYQAEEAVFDETNCHCSICRRTTGAPFVSWFSVHRQDFSFTAGSPTRFKSTDIGTRGFCSRCGAQLTFEDSRHPDAVDITIASLDEPNRIRPKDHIHTSSQLSWIAMGDGLPRYPHAREDARMKTLSPIQEQSQRPGVEPNPTALQTPSPPIKVPNPPEDEVVKVPTETPKVGSRDAPGG